jgi:hypothetical protein
MSGVNVEQALAERGIKPATAEQCAQDWGDIAASVLRSSDEKLRADWAAAGCLLSDEDIAEMREQATGPNPWYARITAIKREGGQS